VSAPWRSAINPLGSLDPVSRHRATWFLVRTLCFAGLAFGPCLVGTRSLQDCAVLLSLACAMGGFVSMVFAKLAGEPFGQGSLNGWDEALAFVAVSRLAHFTMNLHS